MLKFLLNNVRILKPFRIGFLTQTEVLDLGEKGLLTFVETQRIQRVVKDAERIAATNF